MVRFVLVRLAVHEGSVVACVDEQGVVLDSRIIHRLDHLPHRPVDLHHKVPVRPELGLAFEAGMRRHGLVRSSQGKNKERRVFSPSPALRYDRNSLESADPGNR